MVALLDWFNKPPPSIREYLPGRRDFGVLSAELTPQLERIAPARDGIVEYRPCRAHLRDGQVLDRVYVMDAQQYIGQWGVWPGDDANKDSVDHRDVLRLEESPDRLPPVFAEALYREGESGMGYYAFVLEFEDGTRQAYVSGGAIDFVTYPRGKRANDIQNALPHQGRSEHPVPCPSYSWCLFGAGQGRSESSLDRDCVAQDLYPVAVQQARSRVMLWGALMVGVGGLIAMGGPLRTAAGLMSAVGIAVGIVFLLYELRWWLWLRRSTPAEALPQIQSGWPAMVAVPRLFWAAIISVVALFSWWLFSK